VLLEITTDDPGFTVDEAREMLGSAIKLPPWYESRRAGIVAALPPLG
jgi:glyoxalase family protein